MGNHDIGDYARWDTVVNQAEITKNLIDIETKMGFNVLIDTNIVIKNGNDSIYLIGINNWGDEPFKKTGNLEKAKKNIPDSSFKILLSHDPAIWSKEIINRTNIELTLSGHTHGMQLGINWTWLKWSPISFKYKYWMGLYSFKNQSLYMD